MTQYIESHGLKIAEPLYKLLNDEIAPGTNVDPESFWKSLATILDDLTPVNIALLEKRDQLQQQIDEWHKAHKGPVTDFSEYQNF